jgi:hypothetical protein
MAPGVRRGRHLLNRQWPFNLGTFEPRGGYQRSCRDSASTFACIAAARLPSYQPPLLAFDSNFAASLRRVTDTFARHISHSDKSSQHISHNDKPTQLLPALVALVSGYEEPTTTEELWATGIGDDPGSMTPTKLERIGYVLDCNPEYSHSKLMEPSQRDRRSINHFCLSW